MPPRFCTIGVPRFMHDGLVVVDSWTPIDIEKLKPAARKALFDHHGRFIQVHPGDLGELAKLGLEVVADATGRQVLRAIAKKPAEPSVDKTGEPPAKKKT